MATLKFIYFLIKELCFVKNIRWTSLKGDVFISYDRSEYRAKKPPVPTKPVTIFKVESCNALLRMLPVAI